MSNRKLLIMQLTCLSLASLCVPSQAADVKKAAKPNLPARESIAGRARIATAYGKLPQHFEANAGQAGSDVKFISRGRGYTLFLESSEALLALKSGDRSTNASFLRMQFPGARPNAESTGLDKLPGTVNYFIGNDPKKWRTNVPTYAKVGYRDIYPGVDLVYYGNQQQLEYDLVVAPGADPAVARLRFADNTVRLDSGGDLMVDLPGGTVSLRKPAVYQRTATGKQWIQAAYALRGAHEVAFEIAAWDHSRPLIIDPVLIYSSYLGGSMSENSTGGPGYDGGIALDSQHFPIHE